MTTLAYLIGTHPHPLLRLLALFIILAGFTAILALLGILLYARHLRQADLQTRLRNLEEKITHLTTPPPAK